MFILTPTGWSEYELLDSGNGSRLERFGQFTLIRPDPQIIWKPHLSKLEWSKADATFRKSGEVGHWDIQSKMPSSWQIKYKDLTFNLKLSPFKHTGIFPEQAIHWDFMQKAISQKLEASRGKELKILNLFGYTGAASLVCAKVGAKVTHVDASYPTIGWAKENQVSCQLSDKPIRWIEDDCLKFVQREIKRGVRYDGIIMDPPVFGHGPDGRMWKFNESFPRLLEQCRQLLSDDPLFVIANAYAISSSSIMLENVFKDFFTDLAGNIESGELCLEETATKRLLSTGIFARFSK